MAAAVLTAVSMLCGCGDKEEKTPVINIVSPESLTVIPDEDMQLVSPQPFCESDLCVSDRLLIGMSPDYVIGSMGEPKMEQTTENPVYGTVQTLTYDGLRLGFCDIVGCAIGNASSDGMELNDVICKTGGIAFARGLHVGCSVKEVIASFADDKSGRQIYFNSMEPNGTMIYGEFLGGKQHEGTYCYAYIDRKGISDGEAEYYSVNYCFEKPLTIYSDNAETDLCETYTIQFYIDTYDEKVAEIRLLHNVETWAQPAHLPDD